jgi:hypothetical protein
MEDRPLPVGQLGYAIEVEDRSYMEANGFDAKLMIRMVEANKPDFNVDVHPTTLFDPFNQGNLGSCQGAALAQGMFRICYFLQTGRIESFSAIAAYIVSQRFSNITGDRGSTLSGGVYTATQHGLCLEKDWPYPSRYDNREPPGIDYRFRLVASTPTQDPELIFQALDMGLPVQDGIMWNNEVSRTLVTKYTGGGAGGGHSTTLWTKSGENYRRINSWGMWDGDGCNENTPSALKSQILHRYSSHVIYAPVGMIYPDLDPV